MDRQTDLKGCVGHRDRFENIGLADPLAFDP